MHSWQGERDPSVSVWSGQGPRFSPLTPSSKFSLPFSSSCPPLFLTLPSSLSVTFWHVHPSVCLVLSRRWPFPGFSQCKYTNTCRWKFKKKEKERKRSRKRVPRNAETHAFRYVEKHTFWTTQKCRHFHSVCICKYSLVHTLAHITNPPSTGHISRVSADHITNAQTKHSLCDTKHKRPQNTQNQLI